MNVRELSINAPRASVTTVAVSTSTNATAALAPGDYAFVCDQDCYILVGANPSATITCWFVPAKNSLRIAGVQAGEKIAVLGVASGTAWIAEI